jgi:hypothetical protein
MQRISILLLRGSHHLAYGKTLKHSPMALTQRCLDFRMLLSGVKVKLLLLSLEMIAEKELGFSTETRR